MCRTRKVQIFIDKNLANIELEPHLKHLRALSWDTSYSGWERWAKYQWCPEEICYSGLWCCVLILPSRHCLDILKWRAASDLRTRSPLSVPDMSSTNSLLAQPRRASERKISNKSSGSQLTPFNLIVRFSLVCICTVHWPLWWGWFLDNCWENFDFPITILWSPFLVSYQKQTHCKNLQGVKNELEEVVRHFERLDSHPFSQIVTEKKTFHLSSESIFDVNSFKAILSKEALTSACNVRTGEICLCKPGNKNDDKNWIFHAWMVSLSW